MEGCSTPVEHQDILLEVVLQEGDKALQTLALVCSKFYNLVTSERFRRKAHFLWLDSVVTWRRFSSTYQQDFRRMYVLETCRQCKEVYKNCIPGYVGRRRGELQAFYSEDSHPGFCSDLCQLCAGLGE
ncbi:hypothetical protein SKAU_G00415470 [Synaphobranchus kaupii]|uniref:CxC7-like cysteine cluster associated with KDZ transposases domain-containing protein n=1 Tax=Synaphobranchus kaupii TaxID=118154 RepID=A0A9Q1IBH1_SYNKA|nr:hypothetical protein SKAU_G00415470 [Synaphobranchus kaupii]